MPSFLICFLPASFIVFVFSDHLVYRVSHAYFVCTAVFTSVYFACVCLGQLNGLLEQQEKNRRERKARMVSGADLISALRQQRRELESKCTSASARLQKIREETGFLWVCFEVVFAV